VDSPGVGRGLQAVVHVRRDDVAGTDELRDRVQQHGGIEAAAEGDQPARLGRAARGARLPRARTVDERHRGRRCAGAARQRLGERLLEATRRSP